MSEAIRVRSPHFASASAPSQKGRDRFIRHEHSYSSIATARTFTRPSLSFTRQSQSVSRVELDKVVTPISIMLNESVDKPPHMDGSAVALIPVNSVEVRKEGTWRRATSNIAGYINFMAWLLWNCVANIAQLMLVSFSDAVKSWMGTILVAAAIGFANLGTLSCPIALQPMCKAVAFHTSASPQANTFSQLNITSSLNVSSRSVAHDLVNVASMAMGATIIPPLTSETYQVHRRDVELARHLLKGGRGKTTVPPSAILQYSSIPGYCWPMAGSKGHVGIKLAQEAKIAAVDIVHAKNDADLQMAPRFMTLWGVSRPSIETDAIVQRSQTRSSGSSTRLQLQFALLDPNLVLFPLMSFAFEVFSGETTQRFHMNNDTEVPQVQSVVLEVDGNWGHSAQTCIYGVRILGMPDY